MTYCKDHRLQQTIGYEAFEGCPNLWEISIPSTVREIGKEAFKGDFNSGTNYYTQNQYGSNVGLKEELTLKLPEGVHVGESAFLNCSGLRIEFPEHLTCENNAFAGTFTYNTSVKEAYYLENGQFVDVYQYENYGDPSNKRQIIGYYDDTDNYDVGRQVLPEYEGIEVLASVEYCLIQGHLLMCICRMSSMLTIPEGTEYIDCHLNDSGWGKDTTTTDVILPSTVKEIGCNAFKDFTALTSVEIPEGVTRIGDFAFDGCSALADVELPDALTEIGELAFSDTALTSITIPENVEEIGREAFDGSESLANVTFSGNKLRTLAYCTFDECPIEEIVLPDGLETIGDSSLGDSLQSITFPDSIRKVNMYTFEYTPWYKALPDDEPVYIGKCFCGFKTDQTFDTFTFRPDTKAISSMFQVKADHIVIPDGVEYLAEKAFFNKSFKTVTIPDSVRYIGDSCFAENEHLEKVVFPKEVDYFGSDMFSITAGSTLQEIDRSKPDHELTVILPENLTEIPDHTFQNCTALYAVSIPSGVKRIGVGAFSGCSWLESVVIPEGVEIIDGGGSGSYYNGQGKEVYKDADNHITKIELLNWYSDGAFGNCPSLASVELPDSLICLGGSVFDNTKITSIDLKNVKYIGDQCFGYTPLESITVPSSVKSIGAAAFEYCFMLESVVLPDTLKYVDLGMFEGCSRLKTIKAPSSLSCAKMAYCNDRGQSPKTVNPIEDIDWYKMLPDGPVYFGNCLVGFKGTMPENYTLTVKDGTTSVDGICLQDHLVRVILPTSMKSVRAKAFAYCSNLKDVDLSGTSYFGFAAFRDCPLSSVKLPTSCRYVADSVFYMIPLAKDGLNNGLRFIGEENFDATDAYVPATVRTIGQVAFEQGQPVYIWEYDQYSFPHIEYYPTVFGSGDYDHEDEEMMEQTMENHTIHGYEGTTAQFYAERGKIQLCLPRR